MAVVLCPVPGMGSHECEMVLSVTSEARENADSDASWPTLSRVTGRVLANQSVRSQQLTCKKYINSHTEAATPRVAGESFERLVQAHHTCAVRM